MPRWDRRLALASAVAGVLLLLAALGLAGVDGEVGQRTAWLLAAGLALLLVFAVVDPGAVAALARNRRSGRGTLSVLVTAVVLGALVAANVLASRSGRGVDLTRSGLYTLSPTSARVARQLDSDLVVTGFFRPDEEQTRSDAQGLLDLYQQESPRVKVRFADPDQEGALALSLGVKVPGSVVLQYRTRPPVVLDLSQQTEADVTGAILRLESSRTPTLCWAAGDGERSLTDTNDVTGYSAVADVLRTTNYRTQDVLLVQQGVPAVCDALVVLQLGRQLGDVAVRSIQAYLARGGKLLLAVDPWLDAAVVASANAVLQPYGVGFDGGLVIEPDPASAAIDDPTIPAVSDYGASPVTRALTRRYTFFPQATPIIGAVSGGASAVALASTSDRAYAIERQRTSLDRRPADRAGPFVLMRSIEDMRPAGTTRIVLAGTSALAENRTMPPSSSGSNSDLLLASLDWLTQQDSLLAIGARPPAAEPLALTELELRVSDVLTAAALPLLVLAMGAFVHRRRRRRVRY